MEDPTSPASDIAEMRRLCAAWLQRSAPAAGAAGAAPVDVARLLTQLFTLHERLLKAGDVAPEACRNKYVEDACIDATMRVRVIAGADAASDADIDTFCTYVVARYSSDGRLRVKQA